MHIYAIMHAIVCIHIYAHMLVNIRVCLCSYNGVHLYLSLPVYSRALKEYPIPQLSTALPSSSKSWAALQAIYK